MSGTPNSNDRHYLDRVLALLQIICDGSCPSSYREISLRAGIPLSTTHRIVALLSEAGLCGRRPDGRLVPGVQLVRLGLTAMGSILPLEPYQDLVRRISQQTDETVSFAILAGNTILLIARHECAQPIRAASRVGDIMPPHRTAIGKLILAHLNDRKRIWLLRQNVGSDAIEVLNALRPELAIALEQGYALDHEEFAKGLRCLAAPVFDESGTLSGVVSVSGPVGRFTRERAASLAPLLKEHSRNFPHAVSAA